jgi:hypothetical protein
MIKFVIPVAAFLFFCLQAWLAAKAVTFILRDEP